MKPLSQVIWTALNCYYKWPPPPTDLAFSLWLNLPWEGTGEGWASSCYYGVMITGSRRYSPIHNAGLRLAIVGNYSPLLPLWRRTSGLAQNATWFDFLPSSSSFRQISIKHAIRGCCCASKDSLNKNARACSQSPVTVHTWVDFLFFLFLFGFCVDAQNVFLLLSSNDPQ